MEDGSDVSENKNDDNNVNSETEPIDNAKRLKTDESHLEECSSSSSSNKSSDDKQTASTSSSNSRCKEPKPSVNIGNGIVSINGLFPQDDSSANESEGAQSEDFRTRTLAAMDTSSDNTNLSSDMDNSSATVIHDSDTENEDDHSVLHKEKPKHKWFIVPEVLNRQLGYNSNIQSSELFQRRCYGSLHCVQRLELMYKLEQHEGCVNSLNFHPDGTLLASGSDDLKVVIWDWKNGKSLLTFDTKHRGNVFQSKFLPLVGDLHIVTCSRDGQVRLAQVSAQEGLRSSRKLGSHRGPCHKLAVLNDQPNVVLSAGEDGLVLNHDLRASKSEKILQVSNDEQEVALYSINSHPLNSYEFCVGGRDNIVRTYDQRQTGINYSPLNTYHPFKKPQKSSSMGYHVTCAVYNHNGSEILASYNDEDIYLFDINSKPGTFVHQYRGHRNGATIKGVNFFGPKSEYVISGSDCGNIFFWDRNTESIVQWLLADDNGVVNCLEPHPRFPFLCTSGLDWDVKVWVPSYEKEPAMLGLTDTVKSNIKSRSQLRSSSDFDDSQMLWMLWRQLSGTDNLRRAFHFAMEHSYRNRGAPGNLSSSSSENSSNSNTNSDEEDSDSGPPGCSTQ